MKVAALLAACFLVVSWTAGCAGRHREAAAPAPAAVGAPAGPRIAVAPMENMSNDLDASEIIRRAFVDEATGRGSNIVPTAESDRRLRETLGISYGGQLASTTPAEVCKALAVDGVVYGDVLEWNKTTTGIYNAIAVSAEFRLYGKDGTLLWKGADRQVRRDVPQGGGRDIGAQIIVHAIGSLFLSPMTPHGETVGRNLARQMPAGALAGAAGGKP